MQPKETQINRNIQVYSCSKMQILYFVKFLEFQIEYSYMFFVDFLPFRQIYTAIIKWCIVTNRKSQRNWFLEYLWIFILVKSKPIYKIIRIMKERSIHRPSIEACIYDFKSLTTPYSYYWSNGLWTFSTLYLMESYNINRKLSVSLYIHGIMYNIII